MLSWVPALILIAILVLTYCALAFQVAKMLKASRRQCPRLDEVADENAIAARPLSKSEFMVLTGTCQRKKHREDECVWTEEQRRQQ